MIERIDLFHLPFYKKEAFTGSDRGLRFFIIKKAPEGAEAVLEVTIWPEPYALEHTEDDKKTKKEFPFSEEGLDMAYHWLLSDARLLLKL